MSLSKQLAKNLRDVHFGGNWTAVNMKDALAGITWQQATTQLHTLNTIATLVFHINYYISAVTKTLQGSPLEAKDEYSFAHPPIHTQEDWDAMCNKTFTEAEAFATLIEQIPEVQLWETFMHEKYGTYYRNIQGIIEHTHYHLGQIVVIKKMLLQADNN